jgi:hypothetical protein
MEITGGDGGIASSKLPRISTVKLKHHASRVWSGLCIKCDMMVVSREGGADI